MIKIKLIDSLLADLSTNEAHVLDAWIVAARELAANKMIFSQFVEKTVSTQSQLQLTSSIGLAFETAKVAAKLAGHGNDQDFIDRILLTSNSLHHSFFGHMQEACEQLFQRSVGQNRISRDDAVTLYPAVVAPIHQRRAELGLAPNI